jgi:hypothetical protein
LDQKLRGWHRKTTFGFFREIKKKKHPTKTLRIKPFRHRMDMDPKYAKET